ncbi:MAG: methyltransferase [Spirochaetia bacterium]
MLSVRVTTNEGIEDVAAAEVTGLLGQAGLAVSQAREQPGGLGGVVMADLCTGQPADDDAAVCTRVWEALSQARSIYHVVVHVGEVEWRGQPLDELATEIAALPFTRMTRSGSFRASCSRIGEHPFHSPDVEVAVGTALQSRFGTAVDLVHYDVNVRVDIIGSRCLCGYQLTGKKGLDRRHRWQYHPRVTLRTTVAYAMLRIAGFEAKPGNLHDPFCGSGTILLEAAAVAKSAAGAKAGAPRLAGSDRSARAVEGCRSNLEAAGILRQVSVNQIDARDLTAHLRPASLDYIITNPPFGIRMGSSADLGALYRQFLEQAAGVLRPGGVLALLVGKRRGRFNRILQSVHGFRLEHVRIIEIGGVYPGLFVLRR